jgi:hypothetical protein
MKKLSKSPVEYTSKGANWRQQNGDKYVVTGVTKKGIRMEPVTTTSWPHARGINVFNGSKWLVRGGKRHLIQRVVN